ncbi:hypothetical protein ACJX0J_025178, partial [Zea mays]
MIVNKYLEMIGRLGEAHVDNIYPRESLYLLSTKIAFGNLRSEILLSLVESGKHCQKLQSSPSKINIAHEDQVIYILQLAAAPQMMREISNGIYFGTLITYHDEANYLNPMLLLLILYNACRYTNMFMHAHKNGSTHRIVVVGTPFSFPNLDNIVPHGRLLLLGPSYRPYI